MKIDEKWEKDATYGVEHLFSSLSERSSFMYFGFQYDAFFETWKKNRNAEFFKVEKKNNGQWLTLSYFDAANIL